MKNLILFISTFFLFNCSPKENKIEQNNKEKELKLIVDSLQKEITNNSEIGNYWFNPKYNGEKFLNMGIENPEKFIVESLVSKPELIPLKAVLGGTMRFGNIQLLGEKWLIAEYDDGHVYGKSIYEYTIYEKGIIDFKLIVSE